MKNYIKVFILTLIASITINCEAQNAPIGWNEGLGKIYLQNRQDSTKWDLELFQEDLKRDKEVKTELPMSYGIFPVPKYDLVGKYGWTGLGSGGYWKNCSGKKIVYSNFNISKNGSNEQLLGDKKNEAFFTIMVLTDFIDSINYTHRKSQIVSRNNPDFVGQGYIKTQNNKVDYMAFITANREQHALVNSRSFSGVIPPQPSELLKVSDQVSGK
jgi:hypothetical protein